MRDNLSTVILELYRAARAGEVDYRVGWIAEGFSMVRASGRLSGVVELRLRSLTKRQARALIMRAVNNERECPTMGDVANYLNVWHFGVPSLERGS